jgi:hypothetical protein
MMLFGAKLQAPSSCNNEIRSEGSDAACFEIIRANDLQIPVPGQFSWLRFIRK